MNTERPVLNLESVRIAFEDDDAGLLELLDLVMSTASSDLERLGMAITAQDGALAGTLAHSLKGSTSNVGAEEFAAASASLEGAVQTGNWAATRTQFAELEGAFVRLRDSIASFRASIAQ